MLDRLVTKIGLDCSGIDAVIGQFEAAGVAQHVGVHLDPQVTGGTGARLLRWLSLRQSHQLPYGYRSAYCDDQKLEH